MNEEQQKTAETFNEYQPKYSNAVNDAVSFTGLNVDFFTKVKAGYILDITREHFADISHLDILDVGCGVGNFHGLLAPHFGSINGVDVSEASITNARKRHPDVSYKVYDGERLPYEDQSIDLAFTICVMHHVPTENWENFTQEMHRVLKPGGLGLVFEHNPRNPLTMRAVNNCPFDEDAVLLRNTKTISLFEGAGFSDVKSRFILSIPAANKFLRQVDGIFSSVPFGAQYYVSGKRL
jgi:ubiquinone/menaquinone biosynthesis C-methylase UbiE